jgi:hypothetical protein
MRTETTLWFNAVLLAAMWAVAAIAYFIFGAILGPWVYVIIFLSVCGGPVCLLCVIPQTYLRHWYIEFDDDGFTNSVLRRKQVYAWKDVTKVSGEQSPNFEGDYADTLVVETKAKTLRFFLPDYGLHDKRETTEYIEAVKTAWKASAHSK